MPTLKKYRSFFSKLKADKESLFSKQQTTILEKGRNIAKFLDTEDLSLITTLHRTIELYDWAEHKVVRKKTISEKEEYLIGLMELTRPIDTDVIEATPTGDSSRKRIHNDLNEVDLGKDALRKEIKEIILLNECRTLDYGLEEHLTKKKTEHI
ncbi:hypothetical protein C2G38_2164003 [Gigaspora rosea]|uniref:Uncharacterized protein n=1 Tax=Gigaspora rosea TaxID=44941 RepID=A0A397VUE6_9GLOM|nr:hypothetical protein C2G38_2164003 [Gigaspora rosea]